MGSVVAKPVSHGQLGADTEEHAIYTTRLPADLPDNAFDDVLVSPVTFQEELAKRRDVRVSVVGREVIAVGIESQVSPETETDWRRPVQSGEDLAQHSVKLPPRVRELCLALVGALGLRFGAIDLVETTDERHVFLEINPTGQWAWLDLEAGTDVTGAFVRLFHADQES